MEKSLIDIQTELYEEKLDMRIESLGLSARAYNAIAQRDKINRNKKPIITVGDLLKLSYRDLKETRFLGEKSLKEIFLVVHKLGLRFDFEISDIKNTNKSDYLKLHSEYLKAIKQKQEQIWQIQREIWKLECERINIEKNIEELSSEDDFSNSKKLQ